MGSSVHGTPFDRRSLTASATRWPANGSGSMGSLRARARPCRRAVGAGPAGRAEGCGRRACPASSPGPAEPRPPAPVRRSVGRLGAVAARAAALAVLALAALALAVPERAQAQTEHEVAADWALKPDAVGAGEQFRLIFLSSTTRDATSTDIADYNTHVQNAAAAGHFGDTQLQLGFHCVGQHGDGQRQDQHRDEVHRYRCADLLGPHDEDPWCGGDQLRGLVRRHMGKFIVWAN